MSLQLSRVTSIDGSWWHTSIDSVRGTSRKSRVPPASYFGATLRSLANGQIDDHLAKSILRIVTSLPSKLPQCTRIFLACAIIGACGGHSPAASADHVTFTLRAYDEDTAAASILDIARVPNGWITLNEGGAPLTLYDDSLAAPTSWFGRRGNGPRDFMTPLNFFAGAFNDSAEVWDVGRHQRMAVSLATGRTADGERLLRDVGGGFVDGLRHLTGGRPLRLVRLDSGYLYQAQHGIAARPSDLLNMALVRIRADGDVDTIFVSRSDRPKSDQRTELPEVPLWSECADQSVLVYDPARADVAWYRMDGRMLGSAPVGIQRAQLTDADIRAYMRVVLEDEVRSHGGMAPDDNAIEQAVSQVMERARAVMPDSLPAVADLLCDRTQRAWVNIFDPAALPLGWGATWIRLSRSGARDTVQLPADFHPIRVADERMVGVQTDSLGVERLATLRITD